MSLIVPAVALALIFAPTTLPAERIPKNIVFLGDSITAGYGLSPEQAYPALIQKKIDGLKWPFRSVNAGLSGDTTAAGEQRLRWVMRQKVDVLVIALGANDGLRGLPPDAMGANLQKMIDFARKKEPGIKLILAGMVMPPNYGKDYTERYAAVFPALAKKNQLPFVPFLLDRVGGVSSMNQADRIHPNAEGQKVIAETVWGILKPVLSEVDSQK